MPPEVSIIIPVFNRQETIADCVESALGQSFEDCEIIVVNDGSTDETARIVSKFRDKIKFVSITNSGVSFARNVGIKLAVGSYVQFLDSDDILHEQSMQNQINSVRYRDDNCYIPVGRVGIIDEYNALSDKRNRYDINSYVTSGQCIGADVLAGKSCQVSMPLYNRTMLQKVGGFRTGLSLFEDFDLNLRLLLAGSKFFYTGYTIAYIRQHDGPRLTSNPTTEEMQNVFRMFLSHSENIDNLQRLGAHAELAGIIWSVGRMCARTRNICLAKEFFELARTFDKAVAQKGSRSYRFLSLLFGPIISENVVGFAKRQLCIGDKR
jgi:glycosyltransferase involved in cell wall biosynthesis